MQRDDWTSMRNVALVGLGVLLGVVALYVPQVVWETEPEVAVGPGDTVVSSEVNRRLVLLEKAIRDLDQSIATLAELGTPGTRVEQLDNFPRAVVVTPADGALTTDRVPIQALPDPEKVDWAKVIHPSLARTLVEYGLTPYDRGVNRILPEAARKMREEIIEKERLDKELNEVRYPNLGLGDPRHLEYDQARSEIWKSHKARTDEIVASFREQVRKLALK